MASAAAAGAGPAEVQVPAMLAVLCLSTCTGLVTELANWFLVYSTETYRHGRTTVERLQRTLADARREAAGAVRTAQGDEGAPRTPPARKAQRPPCRCCCCCAALRTRRDKAPTHPPT